MYLSSANQSYLLEQCQADAIFSEQLIQPLWSDYGQLVRVNLIGGEHGSVIVKQIDWAKRRSNVRGWGNDLSHQRKLRSYQVESSWYQGLAKDSPVTVPKVIASHQDDTQLLLILEDLAPLGFTQVLRQAKGETITSVIDWLAEFHGFYLGQTPTGLWEQGCYWHLQTRPDEWQAMAEGKLKQAASDIDAALRSCQYQTIVHGDAKLANFCFSKDHTQVAAVDFQYIGAGVGVQDLAYFISSVFNEYEAEQYEEQILSRYFERLNQAIEQYHPNINAAEVEREWRQLYCVAWADFCRFLQGWSPQHWKLTPYSQAQTQRALELLGW
ncbi:phosphotransferase family protein [Paraferrimonas sedimenticola]|uniref:Phosphotransferase n=1 Tax=Paraferrimonas sedimenticola TaxID=375674 RepID=A0AA37RYH8_9GAMM|nr:aminoglycoside phosphotransferase family protein [Paraferrimonas sedimenticola]GLP97579.1 phosphotransferase [Paraferrimonas sedimenticola]